MGPWGLLLVWSSAAWAGTLRFAVMPFDNAGGPEFDALGVGLQSMVTTDLSRVEGVAVVERARLHDLLAEQQLGQSGAVDPATAAKVGKIAQATHVVVGSFTVVGDQMRLDARASDVSTGDVAFQASKTGERDAFFELEASMVTELLAKVGAQVSARERFQIGRHTADFGVFSTFSEGVALFDAGRYAEARRTLEEASRRDPGFELVAVTLADIEQVQAKAEAKARAARVAAAEEAFVVHQDKAAREAAVVSELQAIARDASRDWQDRATADLLLVTALGWGHTNHGGFSTLRRSADAFALARLGEQAYQQLWTELRPRVPQWFPVYVGPSGFFSEERGMDQVFPQHRRRYFEADNHYVKLSSCADHAAKMDEDVLEMLWVPRARMLDLQRDAWRASKGCMPQKKYLGGMEDLAEAYQGLSMYGPATRILEELTADTADPRSLERIARLAAEVREDAEELDGLTEGSLAREIVEHRYARRGRTPSIRELTGKSRDELLQKVHYHIRSRFPFRAPFFVAGLPAWLVASNEHELVSGPRTGADEAAALRHYGERGRSGGGQALSVAVLGGVPLTAAQLSVDLDFRPAADWWALQSPSPRTGPWSPVSDRPTAGLLVGLREIDTGPVCDPVTDKLVEAVGLRGIGVLVRDGQLIIARVREGYPEPEQCSSTNRLRDVEIGEVLASGPVKRDRLTVEVTVEGSRIRASAGGTKIRADLPQAVGGFVGLLARGDGYVELANPRLHD